MALGMASPVQTFVVNLLLFCYSTICLAMQVNGCNTINYNEVTSIAEVSSKWPNSMAFASLLIRRKGRGCAQNTVGFLWKYAANSADCSNRE